MSSVFIPPGSQPPSQQTVVAQSGKPQAPRSGTQARKAEEAHAPEKATGSTAAGKQRTTFRHLLEKAVVDYEEMQARLEKSMSDNQMLLGKLAFLEKEKEEAQTRLASFQREQQQMLEQKQKALESLEGEKQRAVTEKQAVLAEKQRLEAVTRDLEARLHASGGRPMGVAGGMQLPAELPDEGRKPFNPAAPVDLSSADRREGEALDAKNRGRSSSSSSSSSKSSNKPPQASQSRSGSPRSCSRSRSRRSASSGRKSASASSPRRHHRRRRRRGPTNGAKATAGASLAAQQLNMPPMVPPPHLQQGQPRPPGMPMQTHPPQTQPQPVPADWWRSAPPSGWVGPAGYSVGRPMEPGA